MQTCIFISCGFLFDAFRLLKKFKKENQAISKKQTAFLSFAFGVFGISIVFEEIFEKLVKNKFLIYISWWFLIICFVLSSLILSVLLSSLTEMQGA